MSHALAESRLDVLRWRRWSLFGSLCVLLSALPAIGLWGGLNYGIDFRGGTLFHVRFAQPPQIGQLRNLLSTQVSAGFSLQRFGTEADGEFIVILPPREAPASAASSAREAEAELLGGAEASRLQADTDPLLVHLRETYGETELRRLERVGPRVGEQLKRAAVQAVLFSLIAILIYIWLRFQWRFSVGAVIALLHDVLIVLVALLWTQWEFSLPVIASILTVAGYSINDTLVVFDRIRENLGRNRTRALEETLNLSVRQTLSRTVITSGTTLFVLLSVFVLGGEIIRGFAFALVIGVVVGTYSSIFLATPVVYWLMRKFPPQAAPR